MYSTVENATFAGTCIEAETRIHGATFEFQSSRVQVFVQLDTTQILVKFPRVPVWTDTVPNQYTLPIVLRSHWVTQCYLSRQST